MTSAQQSVQLWKKTPDVRAGLILDRSLANKMDRRFRLQQGRLTEEAARSRATVGMAG
ncbi:hypothetical protein [Pseudarthrobacter sp. MM222]|uniref:hypothetical protein n=1 Tax=Pseudarthrobacter sp. MM222 TaxID=3018929 RepID=UPI00221FDB00|nr:hypothetical protein [Pseudarthrobacter sp. MM222]CAI3794419.1 hypothetical protein NKCBBBOE_01055 [Pseudarthrobacter sp. MM222]